MFMLLLFVSMSWICFCKAVFASENTTYSNKENFGISDNLEQPPPSSSESRISPILAIEVAPYYMSQLWIYAKNSVFGLFKYT